MRRNYYLVSMTINLDTEHKACCDHNRDLVECHLYDTLLNTIVPSFDNQLYTKGIVGQVINIIDVLQLLYNHTMIQLQIQSR